VVGLEPHNLRWPGRLPALPATRDESLAVALRYNPTIRAAQYDADAAKYAFKATDGAFMPNVSLEGRVNTGNDYNNYLGHRDEYSGKLVVSWDIFRGGQDLWRRNEMAERYIENTQRHARLQRDALESIDKAWAARTITGERIAALQRQVDADRKTIAAYTKEYDIGQRSLIDLLNAQNQVFTASVSLYSTQGLAVFADYQLLAAMGHLLTYLKEPHVIDAQPLEVKPFGLFPTHIAPLNVTLPDVSSQPIHVANPAVEADKNHAGNQVASAQPATATDGPRVIVFDERWQQPAAERSVLAAIGSWFTSYAQQGEPTAAPAGALGYAAEPQRRDVPGWFAQIKTGR
jgi:adhesin transport system outer membrane protein